MIVHALLPSRAVGAEVFKELGETGRKGTASFYFSGGAFTPRRAEWRGRPISGALLPYRLGSGS